MSELKRILRMNGQRSNKTQGSTKKALRDKNPTRLSELAQALVYGDHFRPTPQEIADRQDDYKSYLMFKERQRIIEERKKARS